MHALHFREPRDVAPQTGSHGGTVSWLRQIFLPLAGMVLQLLFCVLPLHAQTTPTRFTLDAEESRVWFAARANMGGFRGEARQVEGWAEVADTATFRDARGAIELQVASLRTGIALRDRHLRDEMAADSFPVIRFVLSRIAAPPAGAGTPREVTVHGSLDIRGATREVAIPARIERHGEGVRLAGELPLRLTDHGIDPPSRLGGLARMRDELTVHFDVLFVREPR